MRNGQAYQQKTEKFFVYEEIKFGRIDSLNRLANVFIYVNPERRKKIHQVKQERTKIAIKFVIFSSIMY